MIVRFSKLNARAAEISRILGDIIIFEGRRSSSNFSTVASLREIVETASRQHRLSFFHDKDGICVGYAIWAFFTDEVIDKVRISGYQRLHRSEWVEGARLWIVSMFVYSGHGKMAFKNLKERFAPYFRRCEYVRTKRVSGEGDREKLDYILQRGHFLASRNWLKELGCVALLLSASPKSENYSIAGLNAIAASQAAGSCIRIISDSARNPIGFAYYTVLSSSDRVWTGLSYTTDCRSDELWQMSGNIVHLHYISAPFGDIVSVIAELQSVFLDSPKRICYLKRRSSNESEQLRIRQLR